MNLSQLPRVCKLCGQTSHKFCVLWVSNATIQATGIFQPWKAIEMPLKPGTFFRLKVNFKDETKHIVASGLYTNSIPETLH